MTKIAFFFPSLAGGGAERIAIILADGFIARGYEVDFVLENATGIHLKHIPSEMQIIDLHTSRALASLPGLIRYLRHDKPTALISGLDHLNLIVIWAKLLAGTDVKVMISTHNPLSSVVKNTLKLQEKLYPYLIHGFYSQADVITSVSRFCADDLARIGKIPRERILTINNPCPCSEITRLSAAPLDHPWFTEGQPSVILAVGRLVKQKDYPTLLEAFAKLHNHRSVRLIILGEGKERQTLNALIQELGIQADVDMPGFSENPYAFMSRSKVFVLSSAWEGFGNVLVEALACGTQVVSTNCPGEPSDILENGKYGRLVPVKDPDALANAIEAALQNPFPPELLQERAQAFSVDSAVKKYLLALGLH